MEEKNARLTSLALAMSLGFMTTITGCEVNPDGGGEGGEGGEQGNVVKQYIYLASEDGEYESN